MSLQDSAAGEDATAANRSGQMTEEQQRHVAAAVRAETGQGLFGAGGAVVLFLIFVLASFNTRDASQSGSLVFGGLLLLSLLIMAALFWRRGRLLGEVQAGQLERATGYVEWKSGRYQAEVPGHALDLTAFNLAAGSYDFSYLPRSGRVVAAELAAADTPAQAQDELRHVLAVANHFNLDDLPAYRDGRQGPGTFRRLRRLWSTTGWVLLAALVLLMIFVYMVGANANNDLAPFAFLPAMFLFVWAVGSGLGAIGRTLDVLGGQVRSVSGVVRKLKRVTHGRYATTLYYYTVDSQHWLVSAQAYRALIEGQRYSIYYLPRTKALVGIEPIE
jgi:hypothetical protein